MNPKNWHLLTWLLFLLWFAFSVWLNIPFDPAGYVDEIEDVEIVEGLTITAYEIHFAFGWPTTYVEMVPRQNAPTLKFHHTWMICVNLFLIAANQFAIVYFCQNKMSRFGIRDLFITTTFFAVVLMTGKLVSILQYSYIASAFMLALYFLPLVLTATAVAKQIRLKPEPQFEG